MSKKLVALGHGPDRNGGWDPGAGGNGTTEADWLRGPFLTSLKKYADSSIDFYEQNMFANRDAQRVNGYSEIIELHLDAPSTVGGGHIIIHSSKTPDAMDKRLGAMIDKHFGLRGGVMFSKRNNLLNLNVFNNRRIPYRLCELGFITSKANMDHFKANYDQVAKDLIEAILNKKVVDKPKQTNNKPKPAPSTGLIRKGDKGDNVRILQNKLLAAGERLPRFGADGRFGDETEDAVKAFQARRKIKVDGIVGPQTLAELAKVLPKYSRLLSNRSPMLQGNDVRAVQRVVGATADGFYGPISADAVKSYQRKNKLKVDGIVGPQTWSHMFG
ncbi:peptidoglycan-binding protein [Evansella tamaricis]|uniref:Peptidoglycan-binding protein n=1 Tax=Evansella tamaricis TaxID=2069301 RepID=A0ABS6JBJ1_9BACI|nr:peptidoglycan-binding protein [Evansella tamaricis]MBU9711046.1 peptidoglycan-binding protein [Evansella tamaricis]